MAQDLWIWAAQRLLRYLPPTLVVLFLTAVMFGGEDDRVQLYLMLILPILGLYALLELLFFNDALARRGAAPNSLRNFDLVFGFFWRWMTLLLLFGLLPMAGFIALMLFGASAYPEVATGRMLTVIGSGSWWIGYALMGSVLPGFLSGRGGGLGEAISQPGLGRRLRRLAPAGLVYLAASLISNELVSGASNVLGGIGGSLASDAALLNMGTDLLLLLATAAAARVLTDDFLDEQKLNAETARVFE